jgi:phosphoribosylglycinamide formyltransferase-1
MKVLTHPLWERGGASFRLESSRDALKTGNFLGLKNMHARSASARARLGKVPDGARRHRVPAEKGERMTPVKREAFKLCILLTLLQIICKFRRYSMPDELHIAVFASGHGSNFRAILDAIRSGRIPNARIVLVVSNNSQAGALVTAREHAIPALHLSRKQFASDTEFLEGLLAAFRKHDVNFIVLAGYMKKLDVSIVRKYRNRILNIHPALLPAFGGSGMYGMHVHGAVISSKTAVSGATVHIVDEEYDHGPIVLQKTVAVASNDTPETLSEKVLAIEHEIYPEAIRLFAEGKVTVDGHHVTVGH